MSNHLSPPSLAEWLLSHCLPAESREPMLGDLAEDFRSHAIPTFGTRGARHWYWRQAFRVIVHGAQDRIRHGRSNSGFRSRNFDHNSRGRGFISALANGWGQDWRSSTRTLWRSPAFALTVLFTLTMGIGANTVVFSFLNSVLLHPIPYEEPDRIVLIHSVRGAAQGPLALREILDLRESVDAFESVGAFFEGSRYNITDGVTPELVPTTIASRELFEVLRIRPVYGGVWPESYDKQRSFGVILTHDLWQRQFGGDPSIVGRQITMDGSPGYTVFGVLAPNVQFPLRQGIFRCVGVYPDYVNRTDRYVDGIARLKQGVTYEQAQSQLDALSRRLAAEHPDTNLGLQFRLSPLRERFVGNLRAYLFALAGTAGVVLLIVCVNLVNLFLTRATAAAQDTRIRTALGAARWQIVRRLLTESVMLSLAGALFGLAGARAAIPAVDAMVRADLPAWMKVGIDYRVLAFTLIVAVTTGIAIGLVPALQFSRTDTAAALRAQGGGAATGRRTHRVRDVLVVAQLALALVLLVGAGLTLRSYQHIRQADVGFRAENLLTLRLSLNWKQYRGEFEKTGTFLREALARIRNVPGVEEIAYNTNLPFASDLSSNRSVFTAEGQSVDQQRANPYANVQYVSPNYFETIRIRRLAGRGFSDLDGLKSEWVAIVSAKLAERIWPGQDPIGRRFKLADPSGDVRWRQVVGVVSDTKHDEATAAASFNIYVPLYQQSPINGYFLVRSSAGLAALEKPIKAAIWSVDPYQAISDVKQMSEWIADSSWQQRVLSTLFAAFGILAGTLAATGIYGVMSYAVQLRRREIGIRLALGARPRSAIATILMDVSRLTAAGLALGVFGAFALTRLLAGLLYQISVTDLRTFTTSAVLLAGAAFLAGLIPALHASRFDPVRILRGD
jgi:putative ABC transport system permease protein